MFSNMPRGGRNSPVSLMYRSVNAATAIEGASPHKLVSLLYQALAKEIDTARGAMQRREVPEKGRAIGKAVRILEEGLIAPLDMEAGGAIAVNLRDLYQYMVYRLTIGNLRSDDSALSECATLARSLGDSWDAIATQVDRQARVAA
jgi:flagellar protein FliS